MGDTTHIYNVIWSIGAITLGIIGVFFRDWYIKYTSKVFLYFYEKTKFPIFKIQAEQMMRPYMKFFVPLIGAAFIVLGITLLLGFWHAGKN